MHYFLSPQKKNIAKYLSSRCADSKELVHMKATHKVRDVYSLNDVKYFPDTDSLDILRDRDIQILPRDRRILMEAQGYLP